MNKRQDLFAHKTPTSYKTKDNQLLLSHNKKEQEQMTDELLAMAGQLKSNSLLLNDRLKQDSNV